MAQDIDLSPRKILTYLKDFERKLPLRDKQVYEPSTDCEFYTNEELNAEAQNMYSYLNMYDYTPLCSFEKLPNNVGGETLLDGNKNVIIRISDRHRGKIKPIRAILAHEICHKYLQIYNIYYPNMKELNEVYTDLCTIYVGFGDLIIEGYNTIGDNSNLILGYLTPDVYISTHAIVSAIRSYSKVDMENSRELFLNEVLKIWYRSDNKREIMMEQFASFEKYEAKIFRNTIYLSEILNQVQNKSKSKFQYANDLFFEKDFFNSNKELILPFHLFSVIYESVLDNLDKEKYDKFAITNNIIEEAIVKIIDTFSDINFDKVPTMHYECPFCGTKSNEQKFVGRSVTLKCHHCKKYFRIDQEMINIDGRRKTMHESERLIIEEKKKKEMKVLRLEIEKEKNMYAKRRKDDLQNEHNKGFDEGRLYERKEQNKRIDVLKANMPWWAFLMPKKFLDKLKS